MSGVPGLLSPFVPLCVGELSALNTDVTAKVVHHPPTLPAMFDNVCLDGTVYIPTLLPKALSAMHNDAACGVMEWELTLAERESAGK